jgi:carbon-monoxide dehydrogenase medium subunit
VIPASFDYEVAESAEHAVALLGTREDAKLLAGGHSLLPLMKLRFARPELIVDIGRLRELAYVRNGSNDSLAIGALTRHADVAGDPLVQEHCPLLSHAASLVGDPQVRHRGTIGGSLAHGDPASDLPGVLLALDATLVARGPDGERTIAAADFFRAFFETALGPQELLTEIRVPKLGQAGWSYLKFRRRAQDWATVGVAAIVRRDGGATIRSGAVGLVNMGQTPLRATGVEAALAGAAAEPDTAARAAQVADEGTSPPSDTGGSANYRRHLVKVLVKRALEEALTR